MNTVVYYYLLCISELPLRKLVICYLARGLKNLPTNEISIYLHTCVAEDKYTVFEELDLYLIRCYVKHAQTFYIQLLCQE